MLVLLPSIRSADSGSVAFTTEVTHNSVKLFTKIHKHGAALSWQHGMGRETFHLYNYVLEQAPGIWCCSRRFAMMWRND